MSLPTVSLNQVYTVLLALHHNQQIDSQSQVMQADEGSQLGETVKSGSKGNKAMSKSIKILREKQSGEQMEEPSEETEEKLKKWITIKSISSEPDSLATEGEPEVLFMEDSSDVSAVACHSYSKNSKLGLSKQQRGQTSDSKQQENVKSFPKRQKSKSSSSVKNPSNGIEQVACFKCKYCPFLSLSQDAVASHVKQEHASLVPKVSNVGMQCPGCENIFYSVKSLRVHLSEDHNVAHEELENIVGTLDYNRPGGNSVPINAKTPLLKGDVKQQPSGCSMAAQNVKQASTTAAACSQDKTSTKILKHEKRVSEEVLPRKSLRLGAKKSDKLKVQRLTPRTIFSEDETGKIRVRKMSSLEKSDHEYTRDESLEDDEMEPSLSNATMVFQENSSLVSGMHAVQNVEDDTSKDVDARSAPCDLESMQILDLADEPKEQLTEELNDEDGGTLQALVVDSDGKYCTVTASPSSCEAILDEICQEEVLENVLYVEGSELLDNDSPLMVCFAASPSDLSGHENYYDVETEDDDSLDSQSKHVREQSSPQRMILSSCKVDGSDLIGPGGRKLVKRGFVKKTPDKKGPAKNMTLKRKARNNASATEDTSPGEYKCKIFGCLARFQSQENMVYHQRCHGPYTFSDTLSEITCGREIKLSGSKRGRIRSKPSFTCPECLTQLKAWKQMKAHLWKFHGIDIEMYACGQCDYKTASLSNMRNIHERTHQSEKPFLCDICGKGFKTTKQLRNHKALHLRKDDRLQTCETCGRSFYTLRMLQSHIDAVHNKVRPYMCSACGHTAANRSSLKMHLRQHTGDRPYSCDQCEYCTSDHNSLRRHKKRHTGDKPYKCPYCSYACIQSTTYKIHIRSKHPGQDVDLIFSCEKCSFHSVSHDIYLAHVAEHDLEKSTGIPFRQLSRASKKRKASRGRKRTDDAPIFVSIATNETYEESHQPNFENIVQHVSEAIVPGSNLHVLYNSIPDSGSKVLSSMSETNTDESVTICSPTIESAEEESGMELVNEGENNDVYEEDLTHEDLELKLHDVKMAM